MGNMDYILVAFTFFKVIFLVLNSLMGYRLMNTKVQTEEFIPVSFVNYSGAFIFFMSVSMLIEMYAT